MDTVSLPTLLNDHVLLEMPRDYHVDLGNTLRVSRVVAVREGQSPASLKVGDSAVFSSRDARSLSINGANYLFVRRSDLAAVFPAAAPITQSQPAAPAPPTTSARKS